MLGVVLIHGSRDPRPQVATRRLLQRLQSASHPRSTPGLSRPSPSNPEQCHSKFNLHPTPAVLELGEHPLAQQLTQIAHQAHAQGHRQIRVFPLFLLPGNHVQVDLPQALEECRAHLPIDFRITLAPPLGPDPLFRQWLRSCCCGASPQPWILLAHGSQRPEAQVYLQRLAQDLDMTLATWATPPFLGDRVQTLVDRGITHLGLLPFFLFEGRLTQAIEEQRQNLAKTYPQLSWSMLPSLAQHPGFPECVQAWIDRHSDRHGEATDPTSRATTGPPHSAAPHSAAPLSTP
ncbi:MAG: CbiX/SirB N-terminal domain-containing protein [Prochlorothrix sp.]|nr:CbiX/SirB N-terminal domain-containing protein [Prochlorothrix sp.]